MAETDIDIYGDLCADLPGNAEPRAAPPLHSLHSLAIVPVGDPPRAGLGAPAALPPSPARAATDDAVWQPVPGWEAENWEDWNYDETIVVDAGEVVTGVPVEPPATTSHGGRGGGRDAAERPEDFESLQQELLADERPGASPGSRTSESLPKADYSAGDGSGDEDGDASDASGDAEGGGTAIQLDEIRASSTGASSLGPPFAGPRGWAARRQPSGGTAVAQQGGNGGSKIRRREVSVFIGPPPPMVPSTGVADCLVLVGGLPWWLSDAELRRHAEQFGQLRMIRILDFLRSGKSAGIALLEFTVPEAALRAADTSEGLRSLSVWETTSVPLPRLVLVSSELHEKLRAGSLPWPDGGPCNDDLRAILMRQFDLSHNNSAAAVRGGRHNEDESAWGGNRRLRRGVSGGSNNGGGARGASPEFDRPRREEAWADKLRALKGNVNLRKEVPALADTAAQEEARRKARRR